MVNFLETIKLLPDEHGLYKCPLHASTHNTLYVKDDHFLCLHCGASGDREQLVAFMDRNHTVDFEYTDAQKRILQLNRVAMEYFRNSLARSDVARKYLSERGLAEDVIAYFDIGFANSDWTATKQYLLEKHFTEEEIVEAGICFRSNKNQKVYDFYRNRIMFPIKDAWGNVIGFSGRTIVGDERKYINTSENIVFHKRHGFFNLNNFSGDFKHVVVCEGQMDVIAFTIGGIPNAVASLGTALTLAHARMLANLAEEVYLCFDGDNAGQSALAKAVALFDQLGVPVKRMTPPKGCKDPDEVLKMFGSEGLCKMMSEAK